MFRRAASYLALTVLLAAGNLGIATENHQAAAHDESLAGKTPAVIEKDDLGSRALNAMTPFWTQIGQTIESIQEDTAFGYAADISDDGSTIVASAPWHDDGNATNAGLIQVYEQLYNMKTKKTIWRKMGPAIISEEENYFGAGAKISGNGKVIAIGSDDSNDDAGHIQAYMWAKKGKQWKPMGQPIIGMHPGDELGWSIDLSEDGMTMVAGSAENNATGTENGKTEIFKYNAKKKEWVHKGNPIPGIHNNTGSEYALYGWSVGIDAVGDRVLTAGLWDGSGDDGAVKVYDYDASAKDWVQVGRTLHAVGNTTDEYYDEFGESVAMSKDGSTIAVGAGCYYYCDEEHKDYVHVYRWSDELEDWDLIGEITSSDDDHIGFGLSVSLSADGERLGLATAGDQGNDDINANYGYARVYQYNGPMDWSPLGQDLVIEGHYSGGDGKFMSLSGDGMHMVVGAPSAGLEEGVDENAGEVKVYELADDETTSPVAGCVNADNKIRFKWPTGKGFKTCKFVGKKKARWCQNALVASMCPAHCGKCFDSACEDGPLAWKTKKGKVDCDWVAEKPNLRCSPINASVCRKTCDTQMYDTLCQDKATPAPTLPPNSAPTSVPTPTPTSPPTSASTACEVDDAIFYLKTNNGVDNFRKCSWLQGKNPNQITTICAKTESAPSNGTPPAREVCKITCKTCPL